MPTKKKIIHILFLVLLFLVLAGLSIIATINIATDSKSEKIVTTILSLISILLYIGAKKDWPQLKNKPLLVESLEFSALTIPIALLLAHAYIDYLI